MMNDPLHILVLAVLQIILAFVLFTVLGFVGRFTVSKIKSSDRIKNSKLFNLKEYLPNEEISELHQIFYLLMIIIFVFNILSLTFYWQDNVVIYILADIVISLYLAINVEGDSFKNKILLFMLIPFSSLTIPIFGMSAIFFLDCLHVLAFLYFIKVYYDKFMEYSETNSLGITIMLLFLIVFASFLFTIVVEGVTPLDSFNMVSNAFTSNGYTVLGKTDIGKVNAIFLVWSGFILSGVATATLAASLVMGHINSKFDNLEESIKRKRKD